MHISSSYPLYCAEARQRMYYYPPPYYSGGNWFYVTPWLWYDGNKHGSNDYENWRSRITARMNLPSTITQTMWGVYNGATRQGTIYAKFRNDSTASITGRLIFCVTEDSIQYSAPNGDLWHNHVARDYLPDNNGEVVTIAARDSVIRSRPFTLATGWRSNYCHIVAFIQSDVLLPDSTKVIYQGGDIKITQLLQIEDEILLSKSVYEVNQPAPNPFTHKTSISFSLPAKCPFTLKVFDVSGRNVKTIHGVATGKRNETVTLDRLDKNSAKLPSGVYLYHFSSPRVQKEGKLIIR